MSASFNSTQVNHISMHVLPTKKYKTNQIALYFRQPLLEEDYTKVALLPSVLKRGTQHHPTAQKIRQLLDDLYGASLQVDVQKRGEAQIVIFRLQIANEKYLTDQTPLLEEGISLLSQVLTQPLLENGVFSQKHVELEKDLLRRKLSQLKDDKVRYANKRCVEEMYKAEPFRLFANGSLAQLEHIDAENLYSYYQQMIEKHPLDFYIVGDVEKEQIQDLVSKYFTLNRIEPENNWAVQKKNLIRSEQEVIEKTEIAQGKLHIGCRTKTTYADQDYIALQVCNGVFGGFSHSKLFRHVREKESLAYYVNSSIESHIGLMMIMAGIDFNHYQKTVDIIKEQLNLIKQGEISNDEMEQTKAVLINQIKESTDQPFQTIERHYHGLIAGRKRSSESVIEAIAQTTVEEVSAVAEKIDIDTIYFLTNQEVKEAN